MLVIRKAQIDALGAANWRAFERTAFRHCRAQFHEAASALGDAGLWSHIRASLDGAMSYGFSTGPDLLNYLSLTFMFQADFDRLPWAAEVLTDSRYLPGVRMSILLESAAASVIDEIPGGDSEAGS